MRWYVRACVHVCVHVPLRHWLYGFFREISVYVHVCACIFVRACVHVCVCAHACVSVCMRACLCAQRVDRGSEKSREDTTRCSATISTRVPTTEPSCDLVHPPDIVRHDLVNPPDIVRRDLRDTSLRLSSHVCACGCVCACVPVLVRTCMGACGVCVCMHIRTRVWLAGWSIIAIESVCVSMCRHTHAHAHPHARAPVHTRLHAPVHPRTHPQHMHK